jgi:hypothetical protein
MKKTTLLSSVLAAVFLLSTAMANDLHALAPVQTAATPNQDKKLSAIKDKDNLRPYDCRK